MHLGIVHVFQLAEPKVQKREAMITNLAFLTKQELLERRDNLETWSQICVDSTGPAPAGSSGLTAARPPATGFRRFESRPGTFVCR